MEAPALLIFFCVISGAALVAYAALLVVTVRKGLRTPAERFFALYLASMMVWSLGALMMYADREHASTWNKAMMMGVAVMPFAFYGFVQGFRGRQTPDPALTFGGIAALAMLFLAGAGYLVSDLDVTATGMIEYRFGPAMPIFGLYYLFFQGLAGILLLRDVRHQQDFTARNRTKYILLGLIVILIGGMTNILPVSGAVPIDIAANLLNAFIISYAISRYQLLDLTLIVRRTMAYSVSTALVAVGYLLLVLLGVDLLHLEGGPRFLFALLVAIPVALALQPVRDRAQAWVDRSFFRETYDAGQMLERLSRRLTAVFEPNVLAELILEEIRTTMRASAALLIRDKETGDFVSLSAIVDPPDARRSAALQNLRLRADNPIAAWLATHDDVLSMHELRVAPDFMALWARERAELQAAGVEFFMRLSVGNQLVGILAPGPKRSQMPYTLEELRTLQTLANQAAVAVQNAWLYGDALAEKERAQTILQAAFAGIVVVDPHLRIVTMNPSAEAIMGRDLATLQNRSLSELLSPDTVARNPALAAALATALPLAPTEITLNGGNQSRDVLLGMTPLRDGILLNFADITRLKEVERLKTEIVANVSHELRGPLASIKGYTELLLEQMDGDDPALRMRFLSVIDAETDRLASYINDMLDLTRLESGHVDLTLSSTSVDGLLAEVTRGVEMQAQNAEVTLHVDIPAELSAIVVDRGLMHSAFKNLVSNAIKFSPAGSTVEVVVRECGPHLSVDVIDQGPGIAAEDIPLLFTKFYRGRAAREMGIAGTGLGLALARQAVDLHHGTIAVESAPGCGTRFTVTLPAGTMEQE